ncbi:MAG: LysE family translocator [Anaerolineaceae bacterium]|nr:LysE family translocator [Anaerolineaceae bacterium]
MEISLPLGIIIKGLALGFSIAAPVGPIGVLCIRRTLVRGFKAGLVSGLGAASADAVYGTIAATGLTLVADFLLKQQLWLGLLGGSFLLYLGTKTFRTAPPAENGFTEKGSVGGDYLSTLLLTLSNPMTIFMFAAIFGSMSIQSGAVYRYNAFLLVLGVFTGSALWWLTLSTAVSLLHDRVNAGLMVWVNRLAGAMITGFGLFVLGRAIIFL